MEKNLHNDPLDEYVRKSFDEYEDLPPNDMWARVTNAMEEEEEERKPFVVLWWQQLNRRLLAVAATALILMTALAGRYWYNGPDATTAMMPAGRETSVPASDNGLGGASSNTPAPAPTQNNPSASLNTIPIQPNSAPDQKLMSSLPKDPSIAPIQNATSSFGVSAPAIPTNSARPATPSSGAAETATFVRATSKPNVPTSAIDPVVLIEQQPKTAVIPPVNLGNAGLAVQKNAELPLLPGASMPSLETPAQPFPVLEPMIRPFVPKGHWYCAVEVAQWSVKDRKHSVQMGLIARRWASKMEKPSSSTEFSVRLGRTWNQHWGLESGVGYRTMQRSAVHAPRFRFLDGIARPGNEEYDFTYNLDTYGSSADVTLRMETNNASLPPTEAVSALVRTQEAIKMLRVPLLVTWQARAGRFDATFKAGVSAQYILRNSVEISQWESTSTRFRVGQYAAITRKGSKPLFLGYQASAGCRYRLTPRLSVLLEPSIGGDFARKTAQKTPLPGLLTVGAFLGVRVEI